MKTNSISRKMLFAALVGLTTIVIAQNKIYLGMKVPQLSTDERGNIGAESSPQNARGQLIFNTDSTALQYWDGTKWTAVSSENDLINITGNDSTVTVIGSGTSDIDLSVNIAVIADSLVSNETFITNIANNETFIENLTNNETFVENLMEEFTNNVTQELIDSIMANVTIAGERGIEIDGSGTSNITVKLPEGQSEGQVLMWDNTASIWQPADQTPSVKQVIIAVENGTFDTKNLIFFGTTSAAINPLKVVAVEAIFSDLAMRRNFLKVDAAVQLSGNAAEWTVSIENRNISLANQCTLQSVVISYICDDAAALINGTQGYTEIVGY